MADDDALHNRGRSLENAFFSSLDQKLLDGLREKMNLESSIAQFREATGIQDMQVLEALHQLGVSPASLAAMRVFPMIAVAWADGKADASEIAAIESIAQRYVQRDSAAAQLLAQWLKKEPTSEMFTAWETYAAAMFGSLPPTEAASLKQTLVGEINEVATASGGLLGWGAVSATEHNVISRIKAALE